MRGESKLAEDAIKPALGSTRLVKCTSGSRERSRSDKLPVDQVRRALNHIGSAGFAVDDKADAAVRQNRRRTEAHERAAKAPNGRDRQPPPIDATKVTEGIVANVKSPGAIWVCAVESSQRCAIRGCRSGRLEVVGVTVKVGRSERSRRQR